jgi:hypothetical protein
MAVLGVQHFQQTLYGAIQALNFFLHQRHNVVLVGARRFFVVDFEQPVQVIGWPFQIMGNNVHQ